MFHVGRKRRVNERQNKEQKSWCLISNSDPDQGHLAPQPQVPQMPETEDRRWNHSDLGFIVWCYRFLFQSPLYIFADWSSIFSSMFCLGLIQQFISRKNCVKKWRSRRMIRKTQTNKNKAWICNKKCDIFEASQEPKDLS